MSTILWALTAAAFLTALATVTLVTSGGDPELAEALKKAVARRRAPVKRAALVLVLVAFVNLGLWVAMAVVTHDWRWAALYAMPVAAGWLGRTARP